MTPATAFSFVLASSDVRFNEDRTQFTSLGSQTIQLVATPDIGIVQQAEPAFGLVDFIDHGPKACREFGVRSTAGRAAVVVSRAGRSVYELQFDMSKLGVFHVVADKYDDVECEPPGPLFHLDGPLVHLIVESTTRTWRQLRPAAEID